MPESLSDAPRPSCGPRGPAAWAEPAADGCEPCGRRPRRPTAGRRRTRRRDAPGRRGRPTATSTATSCRRTSTSAAYVGPYTFPNNNRRRIPGVIYLRHRRRCACGLVRLARQHGRAWSTAGFLLAAGILGCRRHRCRSPRAGTSASTRTRPWWRPRREVGFPVGHASAQLSWRGLRSPADLADPAVLDREPAAAAWPRAGRRRRRPRRRALRRGQPRRGLDRGLTPRPSGPRSVGERRLESGGRSRPPVEGGPSGTASTAVDRSQRCGRPVLRWRRRPSVATARGVGRPTAACTAVGGTRATTGLRAGHERAGRAALARRPRRRRAAPSGAGGNDRKATATSAERSRSSGLRRLQRWPWPCRRGGPAGRRSGRARPVNRPRPPVIERRSMA